MTVADANLVLKSSAAETSSKTNATGVDFGGADLQALVYRVNATLVSGTGPTLVVKIQESANNSSWNDLATFESLADEGEIFVTARSSKRYRRYYSTIGGTTPSFTYTVDVVPAGQYDKF